MLFFGPGLNLLVVNPLLALWSSAAVQNIFISVGSSINFNLKTLWCLFMDRVQLPQGYRATNNNRADTLMYYKG